MTSDSHTSETSIKSTSQEILSEWTIVGVITNGQEFPELVMPEGIPDKPGVYRIFCPTNTKCYVGESQFLNNRLKKYQNAKYVKGEASSTDRTVQGVIAENIRTDRSEFQIWCCTSAKIKDNKGDLVDLDMRQKYFRTLIEAITIARDPNLDYINKQYKNITHNDLTDF
jgi:hypothetical protein